MLVAKLIYKVYELIGLNFNFSYIAHKKMFMRIFFLVCLALISDILGYSQNVPLKKNQVISCESGRMRVTDINTYTETPVNKKLPGSGNYFIAISIELIKATENSEIVSAYFVLNDNTNKIYRMPGAWGEIEIMGKLSNFEATQGATVCVRNPKEQLNLLFEVPKTTKPADMVLSYDDQSLAKTKTSEITSATECTLTEILIYEKGYDIVPKEKRIYNDVFYKDVTRYISIEPQFKNYFYNKKAHNHTITHYWMKADGTIIFQLEQILEIKPEWKTFLNNDGGYGWEKAGNWEPGDYKAQVTMDGVVVGEKAFKVIDREYTLTDIKAFAFGDARPAIQFRKYNDIFYSDSVKYISFEIGLKNTLFQQTLHEHPIVLIWYNSEGKFEGEQKGTVTIKPEWSYYTYSSDGWGYKEYGKWSPGTYKVDILIDSIKWGEKNIEIKERPKIVPANND